MSPTGTAWSRPSSRLGRSAPPRPDSSRHRSAPIHSSNALDSQVTVQRASRSAVARLRGSAAARFRRLLGGEARRTFRCGLTLGT